MAGYTSGEQPDSSEIIKLNTNENPFPPGPAVAKALADISVDSLRQYPPPTALGLSESIAALHSSTSENTITSNNVIVTNGGDELLRLAITTFVDKGETIAVAEPTYTLYEVLAAAHGCDMISFELDEQWQLPHDFASKLNQKNVKLCLIPNPHAPSGQLMPVTELEALAKEFNGVLVIDEAYVNFIDPACDYDCVPLIETLDNVLILRTFSKGYSLAGLRMAYGLGTQSLIDPMQYKTKDSYNTDFIAQRLAQAAIEDQEYASSTWAHVREQREVVRAALEELNFSSLPSQSNFLLVKVPPTASAEVILQELKQRGVLVRYFKIPRLKENLRITIGTIDENQKLIAALKDIIKNN